MQSLIKLQAATIAARTRTGDKTIATNAEAGAVRVVRVSYDAAGNSTVVELTKGVTVDGAVEFLNAI